MFCPSCGHARQEGDVFCTSCGASLAGVAVAAAVAPAVVPAPPPALSFGGYAGTPGALVGVTFWPRAGARIIDLFVHYFVTLLASFAFGLMLGVIAVMNHQPIEALARKAGELTVASFVLALLGSVAYHTICEAGAGATLGKLAIGAVVLQQDGAPCGFRGALVRSLAYFVDSLFFGIIAYMAMEKGPQQLRYGDKWGDTIVVRKQQVPAASAYGSGRFFAIFTLACMADAFTVILGLALKMV